MDFKNIKKILSDLITDKTSPEDAEKIGGAIKEVEKTEEEMTAFAEKHEELRQKYVNSIKNSTFKEAPEEADPEPKFKSLDEIAADYEAQQKGK